MTTFALVAGMLPVAIGLGEGSDFYRPLGIAIIGGLLFVVVVVRNHLMVHRLRRHGVVAENQA